MLIGIKKFNLDTNKVLKLDLLNLMDSQKLFHVAQIASQISAFCHFLK